MEKAINRKCEKLVQSLLSRGEKITLAESCTGGGIAYYLSAVPGCSACFESGFVTYSNEAKMRQLAVSASLLHKNGAVSEAVVEGMAQGAINASGADWAIAVSGIAGPGGGSPAKPVGTVCFAWWGRGQVSSQRQVFEGGREAVRLMAISHAVDVLLVQIQAAERT